MPYSETQCVITFAAAVAAAAGGKKTKNDDNVDVVVVSNTTPKEYSLKDAYALLFCFPLTGAHHFYLDRLVHGAIYVCTFGFFGLGICLDAVLLSHWRSESKRSSQTPRRGLMNCFCLSCVGITLAWTSLIFFLAIMYIQGPELLEARLRGEDPCVSV